MMQPILIQGYQGSFHHLAAQRWSGKKVQIQACASFRELVHQLENQKQFKYGIMAIENSIAGSILPNYGLLEKSKLQIVGEIYFPIKQNLLALPGQTMKDIQEIHSHPMALLQCEKFLEKYPDIKLVESADTALSAQQISQQKILGRAAIAPHLCSELFGLQVLAANIHTDKKNYTRFLVLQREGEFHVDPESNKASLYFEAKHQVGSLAKILTYLSSNKINLSKLQSFPILGHQWHYYFHADLEFKDMKTFQKVFMGLSKRVQSVHLLGVYPQGHKS